MFVSNLKRLGLYTDEELLSLPIIPHALEEYGPLLLAEIWGVSRSYAAEIRKNPELICLREKAEGEGEPFLNAKRERQIREYQGRVPCST